MPKKRIHLTLAEYCEMFDQEVSYDVVLAASYLQARGLEFAIHFGVDNAERIAEELYALSST